MIDGKTERYALLGASLGHTHSPLIHNALFEEERKNALYLPMPCGEDALPAMLRVMREAFSGFNVTIPYKEAVLPFLDETDEIAKAMGSVNTVKVEGGKLCGWSTDGAGFARAMERSGVSIERIDVLILGCGGTARAIAWELLGRGCSVRFLARNRDKAETLLRELRVRGFAGLHEEGISYGLMCNTTPVGMFPHAGDCPADEALLSRCGAVFDAVYNPLETVLMRKARAMGLVAVGGLSMLFYQAVEAQRHWGLTLPDSQALKRVYHMLGHAHTL